MAATDPLSIATSIIAIASAGIQLSTTVYKYAETVIHADQNVKDIARDLSTTSTVVNPAWTNAWSGRSKATLVGECANRCSQRCGGMR